MYKKTKKSISAILFLLLTLLAFIPTSNVHALDSDNHTVSEKILTDKSEIELYCEEKGISLTDNGKTISKIIVITDTLDDTIEHNKNIRSFIGDYYEEEYPIQWTCSKLCATVRGPGPGVLSLSQTYTKAATVTASFGFSAGDLNACVGFDTTREYSIAVGYNLQLSSGEYATINAYPIYKGSYFKKVNILTGSVNYGTAYRPIGAEYAVVMR